MGAQQAAVCCALELSGPLASLDRLGQDVVRPLELAGVVERPAQQWQEPDALQIFAGKSAGNHCMPQEAINAQLVRHARAGRLVVRLKGGDSFVFGRGGEEARACLAAGVPFDVVPGVTSAVAVPAAAGIPVTHRGVASAFLVVSGHEEEAFASAIGQLEPNGVTVVVLMGLGRSAAIACRLIDRGWSRGTPAAVIVDASKPEQQVWRGTIDELASKRLTLSVPVWAQLPTMGVKFWSCSTAVDVLPVKLPSPLYDAVMIWLPGMRPMIDRRFNVKTDRANTVIMGSSMGSLISLYAIDEYPQIFGGAGMMSTHWPLFMTPDGKSVGNAEYEVVSAAFDDRIGQNVYLGTTDAE